MAARPYANSTIRLNRAWQLQHTKIADDLLACMDVLADGSSEVDLFDVFFARSLAISSSYVFSAEGAINVLHDPIAARKLHDAYTEQRTASLWLASRSVVPRTILGWIGYTTDISFVADMRQRAEREFVSSDENSAIEVNPTAYKYMRGEMLKETTKQIPKTPSTPTIQQKMLFSEVQDHIVAGLDTSQITLAICTWLLSLEGNSVWQERLRMETANLQDAF